MSVTELVVREVIKSRLLERGWEWDGEYLLCNRSEVVLMRYRGGELALVYDGEVWRVSVSDPLWVERVLGWLCGRGVRM